GGIGEPAGCLVEHQRVVIPAVPVAEDYLHELVGAVVPQIMLHHAVATHVQGFAVVQGSDHVPCRPALGHQVDRGEHAGDVKRLVVGGRTGRPQTKVGCSHANGH